MVSFLVFCLLSLSFVSGKWPGWVQMKLTCKTSSRRVGEKERTEKEKEEKEEREKQMKEMRLREVERG